MIAPDEAARLAHLLRRAGFGARPAEWRAFASLGLTRSTEQLLNPERTPDHLAALIDEIGGDYVDFSDMGSVRQWWLYRMAHTRRPLEEKITLFWHGHFATANFKVDNARRMWNQNETFRRYGLGSFRTLLQHVARDPAMLVWLDGAHNHVGKPNENFAREVLELFTLGVGGGYTETDVKEAARAFTGWRYADVPSGFIYDPTAHDDGEKVVLGQTGNWHADDVLDILAHHPSTAKFLTEKLFRFFIGDNPSNADIARGVDAYFQSGFEIRAVLQALFESPTFHSDATRFAKIKSPVEFAVMTIRSLDAPLSAARDLHSALNLMGQDLFNPPNVKGWNEGRAWINGLTLLARVNFAAGLTEEMSRRVSLLDRLRGLAPDERKTPISIPSLQTENSESPAMMGASTKPPAMEAPSMMAPAMEAPAMMASSTKNRGKSAPFAVDEAVDVLWSALIPGMPMSPQARESLLKFSRDGDKTQMPPQRLQGLLNLIVSVPEYQLC